MDIEFSNRLMSEVYLNDIDHLISIYETTTCRLRSLKEHMKKDIVKIGEGTNDLTGIKELPSFEGVENAIKDSNRFVNMLLAQHKAAFQQFNCNQKND